MSTLQLIAPAKLNLALSVGAPLTEPPALRGFHPIASWMRALALGDTVTLSASSHQMDDAKASTNRPNSVTIERSVAADAPRAFAIDWPLEKDLMDRAAQMLIAHVGRALPTTIHLDKRIPPGTGLGGGSADAAAVLVGLNELHGLGLSIDQLSALAARLGSDIPFAVHALSGEPSCLATGTGIELASLPVVAPLHVVVILPAIVCPTGPVYRAFDDGLGTDTAPKTVELARVRKLATGETNVAADCFNDLAEPAGRAVPELAAAMASARRAVDRVIHVTGSGSALFIVARDQADATALAADVSTATGMACVATTGLESDWSR